MKSEEGVPASTARYSAARARLCGVCRTRSRLRRSENIPGSPHACASDVDATDMRIFVPGLPHGATGGWAARARQPPVGAVCRHQLPRRVLVERRQLHVRHVILLEPAAHLLARHAVCGADPQHDEQRQRLQPARLGPFWGGVQPPALLPYPTGCSKVLLPQQ